MDIEKSLLELFYSFHSFLDCSFVQCDEVCITCRDTFGKTLVDVLE